MNHVFRRVVAACSLGALSMFAMLVPFRAEAALTFDSSPYLHPQRLIDVRGRRMNIYCTGHGAPTVVLGTDSKLGTPAWRLVQPLIAKHTRVCSYDSAGVGFSDPATTMLDASSQVTDLHQLLNSAGIAPPFVIAGYQNSGLYARLYADRYPREVVGMVLVAPNVPDQRERLSAIAPALAPFLAQVVPFDRHCTAAAERRQMHADASAFLMCMYTPSDVTMPNALKYLIGQERERPSWWQAYSATDDSETASSSEVVRDQRKYDDIPLIVLTTTKDIDSLPIPKNQKTSLVRAWLSWQQGLAKLSHRGVDFVVQGSTQDVPIDRPTAVVSAIDEVVDQARYR